MSPSYTLLLKQYPTATSWEISTVLHKSCETSCCYFRTLFECMAYDRFR